MKLRILVYFLLPLSIFLFTPQAFSQSFEKLSVENGLSNHVVFSITQYHKGALWFSTKQGIDKYDGSAFKHYHLYPDSKLFQFGQRHAKLHTDSLGRFWAWNNFDIFLYNKARDAFEPVYSVENALIRDFLVLDAQHCLVATNKGLIKYNLQSRKARPYPQLGKNIFKIARFDQNQILLAEKFRILTFDLRTEAIGKNILSAAYRQALHHQALTTVFVDAHKKIFVGSMGKVICFNPGDLVATASEELNKKLKNSAVKVIKADKNQIYIGTDGAGVHKTNPELKLLKSFISDQNNAATINDNSVNDIFIDANKRLWIGGMGINYFDPNKLKFNYYKHHTNDPNSLIHNYVRAIVEDDQGNLWIGTKFGISILNRKKRSWKHITPQSTAGALASADILSLTKNPGGNILAGTYKNGFYLIDKNLGIKKFPASHQSSIYSLLPLDDQLWAGSSGAALLFKNNQIQSFAIPYVLSIARTRSGDIITGGHNGLNIISPEGKLTNYNHLTYKIGSVFSVKVDRKGRVWCASEGQGLIRFDEESRSFHKYTMKDGLPANIVYGILEDNQGNLWLSTTNGLSCFNPEKEDFTNYSVSDGLRIKEFNYGASTRTSQGEMVFGGLNGFVVFKPEEIAPIDIKTSLVFNDFKIFNISSKVGAADSPLKKVIDETDTISLHYNQNYIAFDFTSINLTNISKTRYSWKLEGLDHAWSPMGTARTATYTNLKPGEYLFRVRSTNNPPAFPDTERRIIVLISPPFWKTPLAYFLYLVLFIAVIYFITRFYYVQLSEEHARDKINFFINIAHEIRTPLSLIRSPLSLAIRKNDFSPQTLKTLKTADQNAERLSALIHQLLEFEKAENNQAPLNLHPVPMEDHITALCAGFTPFLEEKNITLVKKFEQTNTCLLADQDKLDKIISNLLSNAIKYTPANGRVEISTYTLFNNYLIQVSDTGLGIPADQQKYIFKRHFRAKNALNSKETGSGIGLMLTQKLVKLHKGSISFESIEGKGSTFKVLLPLMPPSPPETKPVSPGDHKHIPALPVQLKKLHKKNNYKLLIAEDHADLRQHLAENLSGLYTIYEAANGKEALELSKKIYPDIILSDVMMPEMNGNQFCYEIKNNIETSHIPFILLTSLTDTQYRVDGIKTGADIYLEKPFDLELLKTCLENLLENRKRLREKFLKSEILSGEDLPDLDKAFIEKSTGIMEANLSNAEFAIEDLGKAMGLSHASLYRKFKSLMGKTPLEFINQYRLKRAAELLVQGHHNVNEVAYLVGFSDPKYFGTSFKKLFGKNASDFKLKQ